MSRNFRKGALSSLLPNNHIAHRSTDLVTAHSITITHTYKSHKYIHKKHPYRLISILKISAERSTTVSLSPFMAPHHLLGFTFSLTVFSSYRSEPRGRPGEGPQRANPELEKITKFQKAKICPKSGTRQIKSPKMITIALKRSAAQLQARTHSHNTQTKKTSC
uniref:(northern house mosquito) hypothetical protein n=1 Tax=Culex pipiens TaxID=7175 RepID=A0A8D8DLD3_CULPI